MRLRMNFAELFHANEVYLKANNHIHFRISEFRLSGGAVDSVRQLAIRSILMRVVVLRSRGEAVEVNDLPC
jgi:hypothetical protein